MLLLSYPEWAVALLIFCLRLIDVSIGTVRTIAVVQGRLKLSVLLGFFEVLVWLLAISEVLAAISTSRFLMFVYAAGFAAGNAAGILLERKLAMGGLILRVITRHRAAEMQHAIREHTRRITIFDGHDNEGPVTLLYVICSRRNLGKILRQAREVDPEMFYAAETMRESNMDPTPPLPYATGWRAVLKMK